MNELIALSENGISHTTEYTLEHCEITALDELDLCVNWLTYLSSQGSARILSHQTTY